MVCRSDIVNVEVELIYHGGDGRIGFKCKISNSHRLSPVFSHVYILFVPYEWDWDFDNEANWVGVKVDVIDDHLRFNSIGHIPEKIGFVKVTKGLKEDFNTLLNNL